ncbi:hypothetical protein C2845_PM04G04000 [Panicum miliaceum]|uniref:KIB1-4 beta-propeller domain-containing protein n=1 Tax=Panicum miliaceum TaxID=4540 RepID=A0A3L6QRT9_PANMI|nr:hypothetical protein C2845_PM04G04000 [Panicum miliaceum]
MLPEGHGLHPGHARLRGRVRFFNRGTGAFVGAHLPLLADHCVLDSPEGLLLLQRDADAAVRLIHPFTGDVCELPPLTSLVPQLDRLTGHRPRLDADEHKVQSFRRVCAAVAVAPATGTVTVVLAHEHICRFAHASPGDRRWELTTWSTDRVARTLGFHGSLYLACWGHEESSILRLDPPPLEVEDDGSSSSSSLPPPQVIATVPSKLMILPQLVECDSVILVVGSTDMSRSRLVVVRLADLLPGEPAAAPLTSIGGNCLFFGMRSLAVSSKGLPSVSGNSIVLCDSIEEDRLMQYSLSNGTLSPAFDGDIVESPRPSPHSVVHHLVTCCYRYFWNKGLIYCSRTKPTWGKKRKWRLGV